MDDEVGSHKEKFAVVVVFEGAQFEKIKASLRNMKCVKVDDDVTVRSLE